MDSQQRQLSSFCALLTVFKVLYKTRPLKSPGSSMPLVPAHCHLAFMFGYPFTNIKPLDRCDEAGPFLSGVSPLSISDVAAGANVENTGTSPLKLGFDEKCLQGTSISFPWLPPPVSEGIAENNLLWRYWIIIPMHCAFRYLGRKNNFVNTNLLTWHLKVTIKSNFKELRFLQWNKWFRSSNPFEISFQCYSLPISS